jgi:N-acetylmuramate 1-kinase
VSTAPARAPELFGAAVDVLVQIQLAGARHADPRCHAFHRRLDAALARSELEHFVEHGIETRQGRTLPAAERASLLAALEPLVAPFATDVPVLSHRDYMAWNLHVQDGRLRVIDFQDALLAPDAFDLAQLLTDRTTGSVVGGSLEAALVRRFCEARAAAGWPVPGDFGARYRLCALQHKLKVIGRFHFLELVKGKPGFLAFLPAVYAATRRLLAVSPEIRPAWGRLATYVPELGEDAR